MTDLEVVDFFNQTKEKVDVYYTCLVNSVMTSIILKHSQYFSNPWVMIVKMNTISCSTNLTESFGRANIMLSNGIRFIIDNVCYLLNQRKNC
ncbi:hypothetical protein IMY05_001G0050800 [Salix suchowensis]|nr:hypothetical protein IMY05_001G0050800 [Salix suchowensis]